MRVIGINLLNAVADDEMETHIRLSGVVITPMV